MRVGDIGLSSLLLIMAATAATPILIDAESGQTPDPVDESLQRAEQLFEGKRYWDALEAYDAAKETTEPDQLARASRGLLRTLLQVAEFPRAYEEAVFLSDLGTTILDDRALYAEALWAFGLFPEAERMYNEVLAVDPDNALARHGIGRSLAARGRLEDGIVQLQAAIAGDDRPEYYLTLGAVYRRLQKYEDAIDALEGHLSRLPRPRRRTIYRRGRRILTNRRAGGNVTRSEVRFLRSFGDRIPVEISPEQLDDIHTIPFQIQDNKIIVRARVNGNDPMDLVVDTGAEQMVLSRSSAHRVGLRPIADMLSAGVGRGFRALELGRIDTLEIGTLHVSNVPAIINNPTRSNFPDGHNENSLSPLALGLSTIIDYKNRQIILARDLPDEAADIEMPMRFHRLPIVRGVINGDHPKGFIVDTGGEVISLSFSTAIALGIVPVRYIPLEVYGTSGWDPDAFLLPGVNLAFNQVLYDNFSVVVLNLHRPSALLGFHIGGIIGHKFLSNYRVAIDMADGVVRLTAL